MLHAKSFFTTSTYSSESTSFEGYLQLVIVNCWWLSNVFFLLKALFSFANLNYHYNIHLLQFLGVLQEAACCETLVGSGPPS